MCTYRNPNPTPNPNPNPSPDPDPDPNHPNPNPNQVEHLCVDGRSYLLDAPTALRQWERGEKRYSNPSLTLL